MNIVLFANGSSQNHGCEAITKSTMCLLGQNSYKVGTTNIGYEKDYADVEYIQYSFNKKYSLLQRALARLKINRHPKGKLKLSQFEPYFKNCDLAISVGGDNYCYGDSDWLYYLHDLAVKHNKKTVLWGASIEENLIDEKMLADFKKFDKIFVRESISYKTLCDKGLTNVIKAPDPAFVLPTIKPTTLEKGFTEGDKYIGINVSPLVERKEVESGILRKNLKALIDSILADTGYKVMLIPHVVVPNNNDFELLKEIKNLYPSERVVLIGDNPCEVLKYYISQCELFVCARTHASIAAYSHCIPTLVIGYSVKSKGIAKDLLGEEKNFVLPIDDIREEDCLKKEFEELFSKKEKIHEKLLKIIPDYIKQAETLKDAIK